jgi:hypothetical protein
MHVGRNRPNGSQKACDWDMKRQIRKLLLAIVFVGCAGAPQAAWAEDIDVEASTAAPASFELPVEVATKVARRIWLNETGGNDRAITVWNGSENFMSLGIGHFIWFPSGRPSQFVESFPLMLAYLRGKGVMLPAWLDKDPIPPCPWTSRLDFQRNIDSPQMVELRAFLRSTIDEQTQFLILRAQQALPKILWTIRSADARKRVRHQFDRVAKASVTYYPIVDYINFKGEGVKPSETFLNRQSGAREGWGLKQVLLTMTGDAEGQAALEEFSDAAKQILERRIANHPTDAKHQKGWFARCDTYRQTTIGSASLPSPAAANVRAR